MWEILNNPYTSLPNEESLNSIMIKTRAKNIMGIPMIKNKLDNEFIHVG